MPDWLASIRKRLHLEGMHWWQIPALVVSTIAFMTLVVGLRDPAEDFLTADLEVWHAFLLAGLLLLVLLPLGWLILRQRAALAALRADLAIAKRESQRQLRRFVSVLSRDTSAPIAMGIALDTGLGLPLDDHTEIAVGERLDIDIVLLPPGVSGPWITGCNFVLNFDSNVIQVMAVTTANGDFLIDDAMSVADGLPNTSGAFECTVGQFGDGSPSTGWGIPARITLTSVGSGTTALSLTQARITGPTAKDNVAIQKVLDAAVAVAEKGSQNRSRK